MGLSRTISLSLSDALWPRLNQATQENSIDTVPAGKFIPAIVHQTYPTRDLPTHLRDAVDQTRNSNPTWEHRLYDDDDIVNFIRREYGEQTRSAYLSIDPMYGAARADLFRYLLMYRIGGVYLDIKSVARRDLSSVLRAQDTYILSQWHGPVFTKLKMGVHRALRSIPGTEYQQWHIISAPGHPFLKRVIENVLRNLRIYNPGIHGIGKLGVLAVTGPIAYTLAIHPILTSYPHRFVDSAQDLGLDYNVFMNGLNTKGHHCLFPTHYSSLRRPIVAVGPLNRAYGFPVRAGRKLLRMARIRK
jgi:mannosyltransferase OCH1-like enzyme